MAAQFSSGPGETVVVRRDDLEGLFKALAGRGYQIIGPTVRDGAIVYDEIQSVDQLPAGWSDIQEAGTYRLRRRDDAALFGYAVGPHSWKKYLHAPTLRLWRARRDRGGKVAVLDEPPAPSAKLAFIGVRSCELHAIAIQDKVLMGGPYVDPHYAERRNNIFVVALNCIVAGGTCFCVSMRTGPRVTEGHDLALTELVGSGTHEFLVEIGTGAGAEVIAQVRHEPAGEVRRRAAFEAVQRTEGQMGRQLDTVDIKELLYNNLDHFRWNDVAARCLGCANCTMVCPTCFCTTVEDHTDLTGEHAERVRQWDSCFTMDFSHLHGGSVRSSIRSRYRQWLTHKLGTWIDQFGSSGCVGCGRCITWCPVGIDLTEEVAAIRSPQPRAQTE